ncbi:MAG: histone deacetylase family protein [Robiginitomaculum sp.]|nr:histone deacetylase family protein [Robiginitomaculum sp.]
MKTTLYTHEGFFEHRPPVGHAEKPQRLRAVLNALDTPEFSKLIRKQAPLAERKDLLLVHGRDYVDQILSSDVKADEIIALDNDTYLSAGSLKAALRGAGAAIMAVDDVMAGRTEAAFCASRPPGHHARPNAAMGFCLFGNIALAGKYAMAKYELNKIAIIDFDVHHGNGTQEMLWDVPGSLFISLHQEDNYPGTGSADETGGKGRVMNLPMPGGTSSKQWMQVFTEQAIPAIEQHEPEIILVSAGFDAHIDDPLGGFELFDEDFWKIGSILAKLARDKSNSRLVSVLEGGYDLSALGRSVSKFVGALLD